MHFCEWKVLYFDWSLFTRVQLTILGQIMAWHRPGDKPLSEIMLTHNNNVDINNDNDNGPIDNIPELVQIWSWPGDKPLSEPVMASWLSLGFSELKLYWHADRRWIFCSPTWWCHQMETFSALLAICAGNSPVNGEFPAQRPVKRSFDVFFDLRLNKRSSKQPWGWWFETPSIKQVNDIKE